MKLKFKLRKDTWIIYMFSILPLVDSLNSIFISASIGKIYKAFLFFMLIYFILIDNSKIKAKHIINVCFLCAYIMLSILSNILMGGELINLDYPVKLFFNILLFSLFSICIDNKIIDGETIYKIFENLIVIFLICFLIPYLLGKGNTVYGDSIGYKAYFFSQNELGIMVSTMIFFQYYKLKNKFKITSAIIMLLLLLSGILLNTKSALIVCVIVVLLWLFEVIIDSNVQIKIASAFGIILSVAILRNYMINAISRVIYRFKILTNNHYSGSILAGILSGRNYFITNAIKELKEGNTLFKIFFGNGFCSNNLIEMDLFDIFFYLGIFGLLLSMIFLKKIYKKSYFLSKSDKSFFRPLSFIIIVINLSLSGHVLFMAMSGCYFILYCFFICYYRNDKE